VIGDDHICALNEPRYCQECMDRVRAERDELRCALQECISYVDWARPDYDQNDETLKRMSALANAVLSGNGERKGTP